LVDYAELALRIGYLTLRNFFGLLKRIRCTYPHWSFGFDSKNIETGGHGPPNLCGHKYIAPPTKPSIRYST
jgi:hypothetical protein